MNMPEMTQSRSVPLEVVLSMTTGRLLCKFGDMHECYEFLVGGPVWTHQFAHRPFVEEIRDGIFEQHPELREVDAANVTRDNWQEFLDRQRAFYPLSLHLSPLATVKTRTRASTELSRIGKSDDDPR